MLVIGDTHIVTCPICRQRNRVYIQQGQANYRCGACKNTLPDPYAHKSFLSKRFITDGLLSILVLIVFVFISLTSKNIQQSLLRVTILVLIVFVFISLTSINNKKSLPRNQKIQKKQHKNKNDLLLKAVIMENMNDVIECIQNGADINARDVKGGTALHYAAAAGYRDIAELLIRMGIDLSVKSTGGVTALHVAAYEGKMNIIELLIANNAEVNATSSNGWTPLMMVASGKGQKDLAEILINNGANVINKGHQGETALHLASFKGHQEMANLLISNGANVNSKALENEGDTPLHVAVYSDHMDIVKLLISNGANVNAKNNSGLTPLFAAIKNGNKTMADFLRKYGAHE